ncbi:MAG: hypothetical protein IPP02_14360 [Chitinophagaceae bacterium]|jgi:hypothetical protein|nr:hypothetical protein [Chitinophagaceae bacterium]MBK9658796.1 hypothetical protein [Chitinophagaceae bacterium]MBK9939532.1 hypothetical protein [Chitinophagaceae bacterium]MBP6417362.1 hypothetical protein [Chitinophagaceae bacterium]
MQLKIITLCLILSGSLSAQTLKTFSVTMQPDSLCYLSVKNQKAYVAGQASGNKAELDLGLFETKSNKTSITEWFNLKSDNEKVPASLTGTATKIAAISFDNDQFTKCKTVADLKRMTGYLSTNSLAHFAVIRNSNDYYQRCFIIENAAGKRGLLFVTETGNGHLKVEVKTE